MLQAVAHEVKNLLAELALRVQHSDPHAAALAHAAAAKLAQALLLQNPEQFIPNIDAASPVELLNELAAEYGPLFPDKQIVIATGAAPALWYYDVHLMRLALGNVVHNALKHCSNCVQLAAYERENSLVIEIRDDGAGFSLKPRQAMHDTTTLSTGLGLKIARQIVEAHVADTKGVRKGSLTLRNEGGAVVTIALP